MLLVKGNDVAIKIRGYLPRLESGLVIIQDLYVSSNTPTKVRVMPIIFIVSKLSLRKSQDRSMATAT